MIMSLQDRNGEPEAPAWNRTDASGSHATLAGTPRRQRCRLMVLLTEPNTNDFSNGPFGFETTGLHLDRAAGGDRHHRCPDWDALAGYPEGARGGQPHEVRRQPQTARLGHAQLP